MYDKLLFELSLWRNNHRIIVVEKHVLSQREVLEAKEGTKIASVLVKVLGRNPFVKEVSFFRSYWKWCRMEDPPVKVPADGWHAKHNTIKYCESDSRLGYSEEGWGRSKFQG
jgi:hypothetical protein